MADAEASLPGHCRESNRINFDVVRAPNQGGLAAWQPARWGGAASLRWPPLKSEAKRGGACVHLVVARVQSLRLLPCIGGESAN